MSDLLLREVRRVRIGADPTTSAEPVDVLVRDGSVAAVGAGLARSVDLLGVEEVDGEGRWLIPGLWDQHTHLGQWTLARQRLDTAGVRSTQEAVALVAEQVASAPGSPVIGWGHRPGGWSDRPTTSMLDAVSGVTPVVLIAGDGHHAWLNSAALAGLGLGARDDVVRENEWFAAYALLERLVGGSGTEPAAYRSTLAAAAARGVVGVVELEFSGTAEEWIERWHAGCDLLRVRVGTYAEGLESTIAAGRRGGDPLVPGDDRLTMGPLKIISDGSLNTRTAWCCRPYADGDTLTHPHGAANLAPHELQALLARAHMSGLEVATHAIGDAAVAAALDAYGVTGARGSIEHAQLVSRDDVVRMARLGLRASVQPAHLLDDRDLSEQVWPGCGERSFALRWMLDAGVRVVLGSDAPVSPLDPWLAMAAAVHRSGDEREPWHGEQAISVAEALAACVDEQPTVGVGSRGDLVLVDDDPLAPQPDTASAAAALTSASVSLTVVGGRVAYAEGHANPA